LHQFSLKVDPSMPNAPAPHETGADLYFREQLDQGNFLIQRCTSCQHSVFYPRMLCPYCGSDHLEWFSPSGLGTVYSSTVVRRRPEDGGNYNIALVDLKEGSRLMSRVEGIPPESVAIGMPVKARIISADEGKLLVFVQTEAE
jgi:uncharacterized OB-fold protein